MTLLAFGTLKIANQARWRRWHPGGIEAWSVADWCTAVAGEAGEICNAAKKLKRIEDNIANGGEPGRELATREAAVEKIGDEIADTIIYLDLLAQRLGIDTAEAMKRKFNAVSERYGFPERL